jgi:hypothetical protein
MKVCNRCNIERPFNEFNTQKNSKDGYRTICIICRKKYNEENKDKIKEVNKLYKEENKEVLKEKRKKYKEENKEKRKKYNEENKDKIKEKRKSYYENNKETILDSCKNYRNLNKDKIKEYFDNVDVKEHRKKISKEYRDKNKEDLSDKKKKYYIENKDKIKYNKILNKDKIALKKKDRMKNDTLYALSISLRSSISNSIKRSGFYKNSKSEDILGCSFNEFKIYLESKFEDWMTWENRGLYNGELNYGWDIDHIIPISSAETEEDLIKLNHYTNLQPLCSYINRYLKRDKLDFV